MVLDSNPWLLGGMHEERIINNNKKNYSFKSTILILYKHYIILFYNYLGLILFLALDLEFFETALEISCGHVN